MWWWIFFVLFFLISVVSSTLLYFSLRRINQYENLIIQLQQMIEYATEKVVNTKVPKDKNEQKKVDNLKQKFDELFA